MSTLHSSNGRKPRVLVLSHMYPRPRQHIFGIFIEEQIQHLKAYCDQVVVSPTRIFPPLRIFRALPSVGGFRKAWGEWRDDLNTTPLETTRHGVPVYYPRYTSPPKQLAYGVWGWFAYPVMKNLLQRLHAEQPFDLIHAHDAAINGTIALLAQKWMKVPVVVATHGMDAQYSTQQNPISRAEVESVFRKADRLVANSQRTVSDLIRHKASPEAVRLIHYGVNLAPPPPPIPVPSATDTIHLLTVGRLFEPKGVQWALQAVRQLLDKGFRLRYTIVGEGDYRPTLERMRDSLGLAAHVDFVGSLPREEVLATYAKNHIFVLASDPESFGIVYIEALGQGKPIVGGDVSGATDLKALYPDGVEVVPSANPTAVATAIERLIQDPARRERVQQNAPRFIADRFTWARSAKETFDVYQELLNPAPHAVAHPTHRPAVS